MKRPLQRTLSLLLATLLVLSLFAGCGGGETSSVQSDSENGNTASSVASEAESGVEETPQDANSVRRLVPEGEEKTLTVWQPSHTTIGTMIEDWSECSFNKWYAETTGVNIEWLTPVRGTEQENLSILISSGSYPDVFVGASGLYSTRGVGMLHDGIVIDVADHLDQVPNFKRQLEMSDLRQKESYSDEGELASFTRFKKDDKATDAWYGILIRKDYLDQVNLEVPETYDEWHTMLTAFKEKLGLEKPYVLYYNGFPKLNTFFGGLGFGYSTTQPMFQIDGKVHFAPLEDGFRTYLEMMNQWYEEGLIDPDFMSMNDSAEMATYANPQTGSMVAPLSLAAVIKSLIGDEKAEYVAAPNPTVNKGDVIHMANMDALVSDGCQISTQCEDLDIALQWCDMMYTDEAIFKSNWGADESYYTMEEDGTATFTEKVFKNPDGFAPIDVIYALANLPIVTMREESSPDDTFVRESAKLYDETHCDYSYVISPSVTLTDEENSTYRDIIADIMSYVEEMQVQFILGVVPFDEYDNFLETIRGKGIDEAIAIYQAALDRYNAR